MLRKAKCLNGRDNGRPFPQESALRVFSVDDTSAEQQGGTKNEDTHGDQGRLHQAPNGL